MLQGAQQYRTLFEGMEDILLVHDAAGCVLGCNAAACERLGLARNELVGRRLQELESPEHARTFIGRLEEQYARGRHAYESALVTTGGETIPVHVRAGRIDFGGQDAFMLVARDISEQKRAEQALAWELDLHAALADVSRVLLAHEVVSIDDVSVRVLQHARQLTGSAFGYVGYIDTENGDLVCPTMTRDIWKECNVPGKSVRFTKFSGLWGWVLEQREALLTNDPASDPRSTGTPAGHLPIKRFLAAPALVGEQLVGQLALANAERDYTDRDLEAVRRLAETYALAVERMRGAERVRAGEARYRALFESNADAVFVMDHRFVDCNDKACEMWRARKEDIIGREPGDLSPTVQPDGRLSADVARAHVDAAMRGEPQYFSWQHRRLDGTLMDAEVSLSAVRVHEAPLVLATVRDVTERVRQERREGHLTAVLRAIRNVNQLICTERDRGRLMQGVCDCLVETRGYTSAWIMSLDEHGRPGPAAHATAAGMSERLELALARGGELACVARALGQAESVVVLDPAEACADCVGLPPHEGQGVLTTRLEHAGATYGVLTVGMPADLVADEEEQALFAEVAGDVALALHGLKQDEVRRAVERSLRESEEKYRSLFDSSRDGIAIVALDGRIEDANPAFLDIVGYSLEEVRALRYQEFTPAEYAEYEQQIVSQQIVGRGYADEYEKEYIRKDGSRVPVRIRAWLVRDERGEPLRMWGQIRDIRAERTAAEERAQLESQLRQSQKLEAVGQLAGGVVHDLNNVLTAVLGNVELMRLALEDVLSEKDPMLGHLDLIEQAAERAAALTRQLLAFSRRDVIRPEVPWCRAWRRCYDG